MRTENDPYFIDKKNEALKSDFFITNVSSCPSLDSQKIHIGVHARVMCVVHFLNRT